MTSVVADTHAVIWYLLDDSRLSQLAGDVFDATAAAGYEIYLPTSCIVEMTYLVEKKRISQESLSQLEQVLAAENSPVRPMELTLEIAKAVRKIPRDSVPDLPDRDRGHGPGAWVATGDARRQDPRVGHRDDLVTQADQYGIFTFPARQT